MKNKKLIYGILVIVLIIVGAGLFVYLSKSTITQREVEEPPESTIEEELPEKETGVPNPAVVYCKDLGYNYENGTCIFPDGSECKMWDFYRGKCGQKFTFCEQQGFKIENRIDNMGTWIAEYAVCIFDDGSECLEQDYFEGKCKPSGCKKWKMSEGGCIKSQ
ncbi:MAG: hypothetical protein DRO76_02810 [Candidatus Altiarchaeales archaeon]|nr:MAG: hypothetical protein DRO76_02810 [Candidatus Altiarchaeales archaeon]HDI73137.1 DUF333 domain-containing protein [Candidatus Altiarchaeales archaeon]